MNIINHILALYEDITSGSFEYIIIACLQMGNVEVKHSLIYIGLLWRHGLKSFIHNITLVALLYT